MNISKFIKLALPILVAIILLAFVLKDIDLSKTLYSFKNANYLWVFLAAIVAFFSHLIRAIRWKIMLKPMGFEISTANATVAVLIGYLTNLAFPRAGELARAMSLQNSEKVPFANSFGAVIAERVIDLIILLFLVIINILLEFNRIESLFFELFDGKIPFEKIAMVGGILTILLILGIWSVLRFKDKLLRFSFVSKLYQFILSLIDGVLSVFKIQSRLLFFAYTLLIWVMYFFSTWFLALALPEGQMLNGLGILTVLVMGSIGMAIPSQGGIGSYHLLVGKIVVLYGLSQQDGFNLATFLHTMQGIVFVVLFGALAFLFSFLSTKKNKPNI